MERRREEALNMAFAILQLQTQGRRRKRLQSSLTSHDNTSWSTTNSKYLLYFRMTSVTLGIGQVLNLSWNCILNYKYFFVSFTLYID